MRKKSLCTGRDCALTAPRQCFTSRVLQMSITMNFYIVLALVSLNFRGVELLSAVTINKVTLQIDPSSPVQSGRNVTLTCALDISIAEPSQSHPHQYTFYKEDQIVYTKNDTSDRLQYRITAARVFHSASYSCEVRAEGKRRESNPATLSVTGLQQPVLTLNRNTIREGEEVAVRCAAPEELGSLIFNFYKNLSKGPVRKLTRAVNFAETTFNFEPEERTASFYCTFSVTTVPDAGASPPSAVRNVTISEILNNPIMDVKPAQNVTEGDTFEIICRADDSTSTANQQIIYLRKKKDILTHKTGRVNYTSTAHSHDSGDYECISDLHNVQRSTIKTLRVAELFSKPVLLAEHHEINEGGRLNVTCYSRYSTPQNLSTAPGLKYALLKDGTLKTAASVQSGYVNEKASAAEGGLYSCNVTVKGITKSSEQVLIKVYVLVTRPTLSVIGSSEVIAGKSARLKCHSEKGSPPITYVLLRGNQTVSILAVKQEVAVFNVTMSNTGSTQEYRCEAQNRGASSAKLSNAVRITVIVPVSGPTLVPAKGVVSEGENLTLICALADATLPITFQFFRDEEEHPLHSTTTNSTRAIFTKLVGTEHNAGYSCKASNKAGTSRKSNRVSVTVTMSTWKRTLIILFCIVIILGVVVFCIVRYKLKQAKNESSMEMAGSARTDAVRNVFESELSNANTGADQHGDVIAVREINGTEVGSVDVGCGEDSSDPDIEYTEVMHGEPDASRAPVMKGTDTMYSELQKSENSII
ncbi:platelet endothelial cell adhesion molecule-like [Acipenser ruthenus]|uniref:platelet endothelial cell adhesion molecule-like n=1 Tax=Acipenser ruthenus TaxID=7906 RepID=UPI002740B72C|nr:platelet endothelial cell adhesion molecule-like [Acipenser ruthenus]XP_033895287.2 platelet endothelial cell adhesion molecule-like [Acipenser ruthenus]